MSDPGYRDCPVCRERIREGALVCRFCGAVLSDEAIPLRLPTELAEAVEKALVAAVPEARSPEKTKGDADSVSEHEPGLSEVLASRYESLPPAFAQQHARRLQSFLDSSEEQYRTTSVLFIDLSGYTALSESLPSEEVKDILDSFYEVCAQAVGRYNGFIVKFEGDACLAVFGAPVAYERDVESAVRTALEIRDMVDVFPVIAGRQLRVSAGIATGTILSSVVSKHGRRDFDVFGTAVNLAARLEAVAATGTILVCPDTQSRVEGVFRFRKKRARRFKNIKDLVVPYEVLGEKEHTEIERRDFTVGFVGRTTEMARLEETWQAFLPSGSPEGAARPTRQASGAVLYGPPGVGKSRLSHEFLSRHASEAHILRAESAPYDAKVPYGLWREVVASWAEAGKGTETRALVKALERRAENLGNEDLLRDTDHLLGVRAMLGEGRAVAQLRSLSPAGRRRRIIGDLRMLLEAIASERPLLLVLDDLQWADSTSIEVLQAFSRPPCLPGVFFLLAHRSGFRLAVPELKPLPHIRLRELGDADRSALMGDLIQIEGLLPELQNSLTQQASGNPLFIVELVRSIQSHLADAEGLEPDELAAKVRQWVPPSLKGLLEARIDTLDRRRRMVLQCGAVIGQRFAFNIIQLFDMIRDGLLARLYSLKGLEFLDDIRSPEELEFLFRHHLTRETAYQSLLERQRREFHLFIAKRMERSFADRIEQYYPVLAYHYDLGQDRERAAHYLRLAGDQAADQAASVEAIQFYQNAVEHLLRDAPTPDDEKQASEILRAKSRVHQSLGEYEQAMADLEKARSLPAVSADKALLAKLRLEHGLLLWRMSDYANAEEEVLSVLPYVKAKERADAEWGVVHNALGVCALDRGDFATARRRFRQALALARTAGHKSVSGHALNNLALLEWKAGRLGKARDSFHAAIRVYRSTGDRFHVALAAMNMGIIEENMGRFAPARRQYMKTLEMSRRYHFPLIESAMSANIGNLCLVQERYGEAMEHNARSFELAQQLGDRRSEAIALENLALGHVGLGNLDDARKTLRRARKIARKIGDGERLLSLDLVEIEVRLGNPRKQGMGLRARRALDRLAAAEKALSKSGLRAERPRLLRLRAQALAQAGDQRAAAKAVREGLRECKRQGNRSEELQLKRRQVGLGE